MKYETDKDLNNEKDALKRVCEHLKCDWLKLPEWDLDAMLHRKGIGISFAEVKCYTYTTDKYPQEMLSMKKLGKLRKANEMLPAILILNYPDAIGYIQAKNITGLIAYGGRTDRNDPNDQEFIIKFDKDLVTWID